MSENGDKKSPESPESKTPAQTPPESPSVEPSAAPDPEAEARAAEAAAAQKKAVAEARAKAAAEAKAKKEAEEAAKPIWERDPMPPESGDASGDDLVVALMEAREGAVEAAVRCGNELALDIARDRIVDVCKTLKDDQGYKLLVDICGVDYPDREDERFEVVYHVYNLETNHRLRLRVRVAEDAEVPSVTCVWRGADWCEREVYDMYGVRFADHPDMTRILLWEGFNGHPLRKDFPIEGIDTGAAIYPEYYEEEAGPVTGTGTGWKPPEPPAPPEASEPVEPAPTKPETEEAAS